MFNKYKYKACQCPCHKLESWHCMYACRCDCPPPDKKIKELNDEISKLKHKNLNWEAQYKAWQSWQLLASRHREENEKLKAENEQLKAQSQQSNHSPDVVKMAERRPHKCPVCNGTKRSKSKILGMKFGLDESFNGYALCETCNGSDIVWEPK